MNLREFANKVFSAQWPILLVGFFLVVAFSLVAAGYWRRGALVMAIGVGVAVVVRRSRLEVEFESDGAEGRVEVGRRGAPDEVGEEAFEASARDRLDGRLHVGGREPRSAEGEAFVEGAHDVVELHRAKPAAAKGTFWRNLVVTSTMGPGVRVSVADELKAV